MPNQLAVAALTAATCAALLLTAPAAPETVPAPAPTTTAVVNTYLPCLTEDYVGPVTCQWDAKVRSNGLGFSFLWDGNTTHYQTAGVAPCPLKDYRGMQPCFWDGEGTGVSFLWTGHGLIYVI